MPQNQQADMRVFIPITKIDVEKRMVYGVLASEVVDKAGEIMDYESAKEEIVKWSNEQSEASGGKSLGNIREMHGNIAAGKLTDLSFEDEQKKVYGAVKVVDDSTWAKVEEGVLTGFSLGGGYKKRWVDPENPNVKRYTPSISEWSIVDNPCQPGATFEAIKADGTSEIRKFHQPTTSAQEAQSNMKNTATQAAAENKTANLEVPYPEQVWKAMNGETFKTKKEAIDRNAALLVEGVTKSADDALAKLDSEIATHEGGEPAEEAAATQDTPPAEGTEGEAAQDAAPSDPIVEGGGDPAPATTEETADPAPAAEEAAAETEAPAEKVSHSEALKKYSTVEVWDAKCAIDALLTIEGLISSEEWQEKMGENEAAQIVMLKDASRKIREFIASEIMESSGATEKLAKAAGLTDEVLTKAVAYDGLAKKFDEQSETMKKLTERLEKVERTPAETRGVMNTAGLVLKGYGANAPVEAQPTIVIQGESPDMAVSRLMKASLSHPVNVTNINQ